MAASGENIDPPEEQADEEALRRDFRITRKLFDDIGSSAGCRACDNMQARLGTRGHKHTPECRKRYEEAMNTSKEHRHILGKRDRRHALEQD